MKDVFLIQIYSCIPLSLLVELIHIMIDGYPRHRRGGAGFTLDPGGGSGFSPDQGGTTGTSDVTGLARFKQTNDTLERTFLT